VHPHFSPWLQEQHQILKLAMPVRLEKSEQLAFLGVRQRTNLRAAKLKIQLAASQVFQVAAS
jgi:hypothetical protein